MTHQICTVVRLTEEHDVTTSAGLAFAARKTRDHRGFHITLWGPSPCAGGSPWQCANEVMHIGTVARRRRQD
eukprot:667152-Pyramimonas_sp.AAC.1